MERDVKLLWDYFSCFRVSEENEITDQHQNIPLLWNFGYLQSDKIKDILYNKSSIWLDYI